jgi:hypothetical protein
MKKMKIAVCGSMSNKDLVNDILFAGKELEKMGIKALLPEVDEGNSDYYQSLSDIDIARDKSHFIWKHIDKIEVCEAILVVNSPKKGIQGYIGANTFLEMSIAMYLKKKIFVLHYPARELGSYEEVMGMQPIFLDGIIANIQKTGL